MEDPELKRLLQQAKTIAVLGAHKDPSRPAHYVPRYLREQGYRIRPVNPRLPSGGPRPEARFGLAPVGDPPPGV